MYRDIGGTTTMQNAIEEVISQLQTGWVFDAHFVINQLIKYHSDVYIHFAGPDQTTAQMHGHISQIIDNLPNTKQLGDNSCSENIHGKPSLCHYWEIA